MSERDQDLDEELELDEKLECLDGPDGHDIQCRGPVEYRMALSATGRSFPRCLAHWEHRLDVQEGINERYPYHQPSDFDPAYAGERWDDEY